MKSLFSFYKREGDSTEAPTPNNPAPVTHDSPNSLPRDETEIIVEAPKNPTVQTDPGLRDLIC